MKLKHFNYSVLKVNEILSTNSFLLEMLEIKPYENGFSVIAKSQTNGKGRPFPLV